MRMILAVAIVFLVSAYPQDRSCEACTSLCLDVREGPVFGTNLDLFFGEGLVFVNRRGVVKEGYLVSTTGETAKWTSEYGSATFNLVGREFAWCGINEAGLAISTMWLAASGLPEPDSRPPVVSGFWVQYHLDMCATVQEVVRADSLVRLAQDACHFFVSDASGNCATMEYLDGRLVCHTGEALPVKVLTNIPYDVALSCLERGTRLEEDSNRSVGRFVDAAAKLSGYSAEPVASPCYYVLDILTETVVAPHTKWSIVFDIGQRGVLYRTSASPSLKQFSLDDFDFSCESPAMMLDVNAALDGCVGTRFQPFDHDGNLEVFKAFCERWDIEVSDADAEEFMLFLESFPCVR